MIVIENSGWMKTEMRKRLIFSNIFLNYSYMIFVEEEVDKQKQLFKSSVV